MNPEGKFFGSTTRVPTTLNPTDCEISWSASSGKSCPSGNGSGVANGVLVLVDAGNGVLPGVDVGNGVLPGVGVGSGVLPAVGVGLDVTIELSAGVEDEEGKTVDVAVAVDNRGLIGEGEPKTVAVCCESSIGVQLNNPIRLQSRMVQSAIFSTVLSLLLAKLAMSLNYLARLHYELHLRESPIGELDFLLRSK